MTRTLYERVAAHDDHRPSPFCWRARYAIAHKGLSLDARVPVHFRDKEIIAFSGQGKVPILVDGDRVVPDSWAIAVYLEETYPERPSLFGGPHAQALTGFVNCWVDTALLPAIFPLVVGDLFAAIDPDDQPYFRETREARLGRSLESFAEMRPALEENLARVLAPLRAWLKSSAFLAGEAPSYADYTVFSAFALARCVRAEPLLAADDPLRAYLDRIADLFDGLGRSGRQLERAAG